MNKGVISGEDFSCQKCDYLLIKIISKLPLKNMDNVQLISCAGSKVSVFTANNLKSLTSLYPGWQSD
ncbi:hypothetical protein FY557_14830 [Chryseobacterium sp. SN22]|uniref:hypothetical protein n=1 Tax=Chryseobacterium sp. SN22 TaxID=2606431 RepID=UPI0011EC1DD9|nr:hypothetical protein [Chryseobacterium sp. SN22]KAA0127057.1 hypothetical protein FY557_14830 [Chryseobacterium sp. SN22]